MRLPYTPQATPLWNPPHIYETLARRALRDHKAPQLLPLDRALAHAPPLLRGWNALLGALRDAAALPAAPLELAACRVAALNGASFEWAQHAPLLEAALRARGDEPAAVYATLQGVREGAAGAFDGAAPAGLREQDAAVLAVVDCVTRAPEAGVADALWARVGAVLATPREMLELVACVAAYNMVSRLLVALDVGEAGRWEERLRGLPGARAKL